MIFMRNNSGIALLMVLWVLMILSVIVFEFCRFMRTDVRITDNYKALSTSRYAAVAGFNHGIAALLEMTGDAGNDEGDGTDSEEGTDAEGEMLLQTDAAEWEWRLNAASPLFAVGNGAYSVTIKNEQGRININKAGKNEIELILGSLDLDEETRTGIINAILDWRDSDSFVRIDGAEDRYYQSLDPPYSCGNKDFAAKEELMLVKGITREIYFTAFEPMITVRSQAEDGKININSASETMLQSLPGMTEELVEAVVLYRETQNFDRLSDFKEIVGADIYKALDAYVTLKNSSFYTIASTGTTAQASDVEKRAQGVVEIDDRYDKGYRIVEFTCGGRT